MINELYFLIKRTIIKYKIDMPTQIIISIVLKLVVLYGS